MAEEYLKRAMERGPEHLESYRSLGDLYMEMRQYDAATEIYIEGLDLELTQRERAEMERILNEADARRRVAIAWALFKDDHLDEAFEQTEHAIGLDPNYIESYHVRGEIHLKRGEFELAVIDLEKVVTTAPNRHRGAERLLESARRRSTGRTPVSEASIQENHLE